VSVIHLDFETYSEADLRVVGLINYVRHPSARVLLASWTDERGEYQYDSRAADATLEPLLQALATANEIHAWNASFEYAVLTHVLKQLIPLERMRCTMAHALYRAFPASLDNAAQVFGLEGKTSQASRLIRVFCTPGGLQYEKPGDWELFKQYNRDDVKLETAIAEKLAPFPWPEAERKIWLMGEHINLRGCPVDVDRANAADAVFAMLAEEATSEIKSLTGVGNPNSPLQIREWLVTQGVRTDSLDKGRVATLLKTELPRAVQTVLQLRQGAALSAPKKYSVAVRQAFEGRLCHSLQYSGAGRTHRWSGRGLQPQNLRRGLKTDDQIRKAWGLVHQCHGERSVLALQHAYPDPFSLVADLVRSIIRAPHGSLVVADYASIEVVMLFWLAGAQARLQEFRDGLDAYKVAASSQFGVPYEDVTAEQRTYMKPVVLGCGYGMGAAALAKYAEGLGITMAPAETSALVSKYRALNPEVTDLWHGLGTAMAETIKTGKSHRFGHVSFRMVRGACLMLLPSGAEITYWNARVYSKTTTEGIRPWTRDQIVYEGLSPYTKEWGDVETWGGKLAENADQSISRDVLAYGMQRATEAGCDIVLHVHDEVVVCPTGQGENTPQELAESMVAPPWCADAPIKTHVFVCDSYRKD